MRGRSRLANDAWEAILSAHAVLMRRFAAEDIWSTVSMREYDVLYTLSKCTQPVRMGELNRHVLLSQPALSRLVDRLVERGLVERSHDERDARSVRVGLTADGRAIQREVGLRHGRSVAALVGGALSTEDLETLERLGRALAEHADRA